MGWQRFLFTTKACRSREFPFDIRLLPLGGQRVIPHKALSSGFVFRHETLRSAFEAIL